MTARYSTEAFSIMNSHRLLSISHKIRDTPVSSEQETQF